MLSFFLEALQNFRPVNILAVIQIRNEEGKTAFEVCGEPEAKAELQKWEASVGLRYTMRQKLYKNDTLLTSVVSFFTYQVDEFSGRA